MNNRNITKVASITGAVLSTAYAVYRIVLSMNSRKTLAVANKKYDSKLEDSMDCSDAVASY
jgi:hypothetical protein